MKNKFIVFFFISAFFIYCSGEDSISMSTDTNLQDIARVSDVVDVNDILDSSTTDISIIPKDEITIEDNKTIEDTAVFEDIVLDDILSDVAISDNAAIDTLDNLQDTESLTDVITEEKFRLDSPQDGEHYKRLSPVLFKGYTTAPFVVLAEGYYKFAEWNQLGDFEFSYSFYGTGNREISFVVNGKTELIIHLTIEEPDKTFAQYILETVDLLIKEDSNLGYGEGQHTRSLYYNSDLIFTVKDRTSHCVGITMQTLVMAMNKYFDDTKDSRVWNMPSSWLKWEPFKHCWYVDSAIKCYGARDALVKYGIGEKVDDFSKLKPADFVNYDRTNGTGHSVIFLNYLYDDGTSGTDYKSNAIGFKYFSSQGSTNGAGYKNAFFDGFCSDKFTNKDCGIIKSSLVMGRVWEPRDFIPQKEGVIPFGQSDYNGSDFVDLNYFNDLGSDRLK